jgi:hypothetical protein
MGFSTLEKSCGSEVERGCTSGAPQKCDLEQTNVLYCWIGNRYRTVSGKGLGLWYSRQASANGPAEIVAGRRFFDLIRSLMSGWHRG